MNSATCVSPSKAFNLAGLQIADIVAADEQVRRRIDRAVNINEVCDVNPFGVAATIAAYDESGAWLDALRKYLWGNYEYLRRFFEERLPQYPSCRSKELTWSGSIAGRPVSARRYALRLQKEQKLMVNSGTLYGPGGEGFIRLNIACPWTLLADGLERRYVS
ncbi:MAG: aminotransferase class I/II-fold pyridoxal phosphate-dependent enzyme [Alistipes sp.]